ncbi:MAG: HlyD family efflux transporter periplasmic adaptor subunit, partial [Planctomycetota bacterium]|nr:HlyD family efflux transporter periplasmic adaptor subunit [Planctomycetota bacterium]
MPERESPPAAAAGSAPGRPAAPAPVRRPGGAGRRRGWRDALEMFRSLKWLAAMSAAGLAVLVGSIWAAAKYGGRGNPGLDRRPVFVAAPGLVEATSGLRSLGFPLSGRIKAVHVEEGDAVKKGQVLAELDQEDLLARLAAARAEAEIAAADLGVLDKSLEADLAAAEREVERRRAEYEKCRTGPRKEEVERAKAEVKAAEAELEMRIADTEKFSDLTASTRRQYDLAKGQQNIAEAALAAARARLKELESGSRPEDVATAEATLRVAEAGLQRVRSTREARLKAARARLEQARAQAAYMEAEAAKGTIRSPVDGVVVWKYKHAGETVGAVPPETVLVVADTSKLRVRADVDEADFARIYTGMPARVRADAFGEKDFVGRVTCISASAGEKSFLTGEARERRDVRGIQT